MCLILFAHNVHPDFRLVLAANRDEFHARPTAPAAFWTDAPAVLAGRDLIGGGTWLGVTRSGRLAAVTNVRDASDQRPGTPSRGLLARDFLLQNTPPAAFQQAVATRGAAFKGFSLLAGDAGQLTYYNNRQGAVRTLKAGLYGLSNAFLDTPWPKLTRGRSRFAEILAASVPPDPEELFALLADRSRPPDDQLPETGFSLDWERILAPAFVISPRYGTRCSTVILLSRDGELLFIERTFAGDPQQWTEVRFRYRLEPAASAMPEGLNRGD